MSASDVLVVASQHEGFGVPVIEAMAMGLPVVANRAGALPEIVGDAGVLVDALDPYALAAGIERGQTGPGAPPHASRTRRHCESPRSTCRRRATAPSTSLLPSDPAAHRPADRAIGHQRSGRHRLLHQRHEAPGRGSQVEPRRPLPAGRRQN